MCSLTTFLQDFFGFDDGFEQPWARAAQNRRQNKKCRRKVHVVNEHIHMHLMLVEISSEGAISLGSRSRTQPAVVYSRREAATYMVLFIEKGVARRTVQLLIKGS